MRLAFLRLQQVLKDMQDESSDMTDQVSCALWLFTPVHAFLHVCVRGFL